MADYDLEAKITADASGYEAGVKKAEKASKKLSTSVSKVIQGLGKNGLVGALGAVGLASSGLSATLGSVVKIARKVSETINECTNAYKSQLIAEKALDTAIQNNPFITGESSKALLQFASDMQKVSNYGDDELIPMMTNLISLGRTEAETMQIMSVAMDMSAGMGISLDTAITQLNATLNGNIGRLGQQNAELKDLTEVELRSGKAIEILGEKFKGLSSATADTSKQLQNMKGDFKEALGQFTLPSSDLWNKFWAGFYERGIEVINKINAFMDSQIIGKKLANAITEQIARINPADIGGRVDYTRNVLRVIGDNELEALKNYLSGLRSLSAEQEIILKRIKAEEDSRYQSAVNAKKEAEAKAEQAKAEEIITIQAEEQKKIEAKKTDWTSKLLDQRIEMLETERDKAMQLAEEEGEETYIIWRDYNEKILELKLERLEAEKKKSLEEEHLTVEDKIAIEEYYESETKKIYDELGEYKKKKGKEEEKDTEFMYNAIIQMAKKYAESIKNIFSKIANTIKDVFSKIGNFVKNVFDKTKNIFTKLFDFNVDDALNALLKIEDAILTFFVETLPRLPSFFESAVSSISILINTLNNTLDWDKIKGFLDSIVNTFVTNAPEIVSGIVEIFSNLVTTISNVLIENAPQIVDALGQMFFTIIEALPTLIENLINAIGTFLSELGKYITENGEKLAQDLSNIVSSIVEGIVNFIKNGGWKNILDALLAIQKALEKAVMDNIEDLVNAIVDALPDLINMLIESIVSASKTLAKLIKPILKLIIALIKALIEVAFSDEVLDASIEVVQSLIESLLDMFINEFPKILPKMITKITGFITKSLPKMTNAIIKSLVKVLLNTNWGEVFYEVIVGIGESFGEIGEMLKDIFEDAFNTIGEVFNTIWEGIFANPWLWHVLNGVGENISNFFNSLGEGMTWVVNQIKSSFEWAFNGIKSFFDGIFQGITWGIQQIQQAFQWLKGGWDWFWGGPSSWFGWAKGTNNAPKGLALVGEQGPELVRFNGGEQVLNTRNTQRLLSDAGNGKSGNTFNVTFNNMQDTSAFAMVQQLKQYNRQMAINGVL